MLRQDCLKPVLRGVSGGLFMQETDESFILFRHLYSLNYFVPFCVKTFIGPFTLIIKTNPALVA